MGGGAKGPFFKYSKNTGELNDGGKTWVMGCSIGDWVKIGNVEKGGGGESTQWTRAFTLM